MNKIIKELQSFNEISEKIKSSHWSHHLKKADYLNVDKTFGFGTYSKKNKLKAPFDFLLSLDNISCSD
ncbi:hypothetical protein OAK12_01335, partial [Alphaproteobacteria bacterium]|nr:hypothetical protein [Alphaproteobacteria bacterium]